MIKLINCFSGKLIRLISLLLLNFFPQWELQLTTIKNTVVDSNKRRKKIPESLTYSLVKIEDRRYFHHEGIDVYGIIRAGIKNVTSKRIEGGSTIVQQLIRNITDERKILLKRKLKEIFFATIIDNEFSKEEILFAYFDTYKFGNYIGVFDLCKSENYNLDKLTLNQSAEIVARFKYPTIKITNYIRYLKRVRTIELKTTHNNLFNNY